MTDVSLMNKECKNGNISMPQILLFIRFSTTVAA